MGEGGRTYSQRHCYTESKSRLVWERRACAVHTQQSCSIKSQHPGIRAPGWSQVAKLSREQEVLKSPWQLPLTHTVELS